MFDHISGKVENPIRKPNIVTSCLKKKKKRIFFFGWYHSVELCLKWGWHSVLVKRWIEDYWCLFVVMTMLIFFYSKGWNFSFCLFHIPWCQCFLRALFSSSGRSDVESQKAVSDWCSAFGMSLFFLYDEYVCASAHVFWYMLWILSVWMSMKA